MGEKYLLTTAGSRWSSLVFAGLHWHEHRLSGTLTYELQLLTHLRNDCGRIVLWSFFFLECVFGHTAGVEREKRRRWREWRFILKIVCVESDAGGDLFSNQNAPSSQNLPRFVFTVQQLFSQAYRFGSQFVLSLRWGIYLLLIFNIVLLVSHLHIHIYIYLYITLFWNLK